MAEDVLPEAVSYRQEYRRCGKQDCPACVPGGPRHGPYWYAYWQEDGRRHVRYLGRQAPPVAIAARHERALLAGPRADSAGTGAVVPASLRVRTLGGFAVWRGDTLIAQEQWARRKVAALFKALLGAPGYRLHREQAIELLWPDAAEGAHAGALRTTIHLLRKALQPPDAAAAGYLRSRGDWLVLAPAPDAAAPPDWLDAAHFAHMATEALSADDPAICRRALALYTGDYLPDDPYQEWAVSRREELRHLHLALLLHLAGLVTDTDEVERRTCLKQALDAEPGHEEAARALMCLHAEAGRLDEVERVYQAVATGLRDELGLDPAPETVALRDELLGRARPIPIVPATITALCLAPVPQVPAPGTLDPQRLAAVAREHHGLLPARSMHEARLPGSADAACGRRIVFSRAASALAAALELQRFAVASGCPLSIGVHTGDATPRRGEYAGPALDGAARLAALAYPGQILVSPETRLLARHNLPLGARLPPLGSFHLVDDGAPERLFALTHPALSDRFPPLRARPARVTNLPAPLTSFVGRARELRTVRRLIAGAPGASRLLTLAGPGGVGKTRLALEAIADLLPAFAHGVWLINLAVVASTDDEDTIARLIMDALSLKEEPDHGPGDLLQSYLRTRHLLLLLDNCEHLRAPCAALVAALLAACPRLRIMTTSREPLGVPGETVYRIPTLGLPPLGGPHLAADIVHTSEAVALFVERARAVSPDFLLTTENAEHIVAICRQLDGIPLAIELTSARLGLLSPAELAARLRNQLWQLTGGSYNPRSRQRTLRATLDWSYDLLAPAERGVLRRLAVFADGWTLEAAEAVCAVDVAERTRMGVPDLGQEPMLDLLTALYAKSLVERGEPPAGSTRYHLLEPVRQYALEQLEAHEELAHARNRHLHWYLSLAEAAAPQLQGPEQAIWLQRLDAEQQNLRAALQWSQQDLSACEAGVRLGTALQAYWWMRNQAREGRRWLERGLRRASAVPQEIRARALKALGALVFRAHDYAGAAAFLGESVALYRALENRSGLAGALVNQAMAMQSLGDFPGAVARYEEAAALDRAAGDRWGLSVTLLNLGGVLHDMGHYARAISCLEESLALKQEVGDTYGSAGVVHNLARTLLQVGQLARATALCEQALEILRALDDQVAVAGTITNLALLAYERGDLSRAEALHRENLALRRTLEDPLLFQDLTGLAHIAMARDDPARAARLLAAAEAQRAALRYELSLDEQEALERDSTQVRAALGDEWFDAASAAGRALSVDQALALALDAPHAPT